MRFYRSGVMVGLTRYFNFTIFAYEEVERFRADRLSP